MKKIKIFDKNNKTISDDFNVMGGYYNLDTNTKALIAKSNSDNIKLTYFFPINDIKKKVIFPVMEISDETLDGFNNVGDGVKFIGFNGFNMLKMTQNEIKPYLEYNLSYNPMDIPNNW